MKAGYIKLCIILMGGLLISCHVGKVFNADLEVQKRRYTNGYYVDGMIDMNVSTATDRTANRAVRGSENTKKNNDKKQSSQPEVTDLPDKKFKGPIDTGPKFTKVYHSQPTLSNASMDTSALLQVIQGTHNKQQNETGPDEEDDSVSVLRIIAAVIYIILILAILILSAYIMFYSFNSLMVP